MDSLQYCRRVRQRSTGFAGGSPAITATATQSKGKGRCAIVLRTLGWSHRPQRWPETAARRIGAEALLRLTWHIAKKERPQRTSARMGNKEVPETHHDDPEVGRLSELSRRRRSAAAAMVLPRGAQPEPNGPELEAWRASVGSIDGVRARNRQEAHRNVVGEEDGTRGRKWRSFKILELLRMDGQIDRGELLSKPRHVW